MEGAAGQSFTNAGVMARQLLRNDTEARSYFVQGAARGDMPAYYWLGVMARAQHGAGNASDADACRYFRAIIMQSVETAVRIASP